MSWTPEQLARLDYAGLSAWMGIRDLRMIGTAVTVVHTPETGPSPAFFGIWLHDTLIARVEPGLVRFGS